ncbi:hypothetical protein ACPPVT_08355 [Angustibacter sp. McL0619]|uniref:hypothetical protein n=1 Tax=Angustibacter sp. McL0619 TaxID=3415676 RepID=UPI003CE91028
MKQPIARALSAAAALTLAALGVVVPASVASAHTGTLSVSAACLPSGDYRLTYTGKTTNVPADGLGHKATLTVGELKPSGASATPASQRVVGNTGYAFTVTVPGTTTYAQATAFLAWGDGSKADPIGKINLNGNCRTVVIPAAPTVTKATACGTGDTLNVPADSKSITYATKHDRQHYTVTATANEGYVFAGGKTVVTWEFDLGSADACLIVVTPTEPTVIKADDCDSDDVVNTPSDTDSITYQTVRDGHNVTITATAKPGFVFADGKTVKVYRIVVNHTAPCPASVTATKPGVTSPKCATNGALSIPQDVAHIGYTVEPRQGATGLVSPSTYGPGTYTVTAAADEGYVLAGDHQWKFTVRAKVGNCPTATTPPALIPPTHATATPVILPNDKVLAYTGINRQAAGTTIGVALALLAGGFLLVAAATRRREADNQ